jgi:hypothetical protein
MSDLLIYHAIRSMTEPNASKLTRLPVAASLHFVMDFNSDVSVEIRRR